MEFDFINNLSESSLIASKSNFRRYTAMELADLAVLYLCALYIMYKKESTEDFAKDYAKRTMQGGNYFDKWKNSGTDLYMILYGLSVDDVVLDDQEESDHFKNYIPIGYIPLSNWLKEMSTGRLKDFTHRTLFVKLDFYFKLDNSSIKAVRRLIMDWEKLSTEEQKLATTRLLQLLRARASKSEILYKFSKMAHEKNLILHDICDKETGIGCAITKVVNKTKNPEKKGGNFLLALAAVAAGVSISNLRDKK